MLTQVLALAPIGPPVSRSQQASQAMRHALNQRAVTTYEGIEPGYRSSSLSARAHQGNASSAPQPQKPEKSKDQYCRMCGTQMELAIPKGEAAWRHVCSNCGYIDYFNPKMVRLAPG